MGRFNPGEKGQAPEGVMESEAVKYEARHEQTRYLTFHD